MKFPRPQKTSAKLIQKSQLAEGIWYYKFHLDTQIEFLPGQFASFEIERGLHRSYSILSVGADRDTADFVVDIRPGGVGSQYFSNLEIGDNASVLLPLGRFVIKDETNTSRFIFVATGTGIVPLWAMINKLVESDNQILLLWGLKNHEVIYFDSILKELANNAPNFKYIYCLSFGGEVKGSETEYSGRVTGYLTNHHIDKTAHYYLCGGQSMIDDVRHLLLKSGVDSQSIFFEQFY